MGRTAGWGNVTLAFPRDSWTPSCGSRAPHPGAEETAPDLLPYSLSAPTPGNSPSTDGHTADCLKKAFLYLVPAGSVNQMLVILSRL